MMMLLKHLPIATIFVILDNTGRNVGKLRKESFYRGSLKKFDIHISGTLECAMNSSLVEKVLVKLVDDDVSDCEKRFDKLPWHKRNYNREISYSTALCFHVIGDEFSYGNVDSGWYNDEEEAKKAMKPYIYSRRAEDFTYYAPCKPAAEIPTNDNDFMKATTYREHPCVYWKTLDADEKVKKPRDNNYCTLENSENKLPWCYADLQYCYYAKEWFDGDNVYCDKNRNRKKTDCFKPCSHDAKNTIQNMTTTWKGEFSFSLPYKVYHDPELRLDFSSKCNKKNEIETCHLRRRVHLAEKSKVDLGFIDIDGKENMECAKSE